LPRPRDRLEREIAIQNLLMHFGIGRRVERTGPNALKDFDARLAIGMIGADGIHRDVAVNQNRLSQCHGPASADRARARCPPSRLSADAGWSGSQMLPASGDAQAPGEASARGFPAEARSQTCAPLARTSRPARIAER